jgi:GrpB protein
MSQIHRLRSSIQLLTLGRAPVARTFALCRSQVESGRFVVRVDEGFSTRIFRGMKFLPPNDYQPLALRSFERLRADLSKVLPAAEVEHIGSSAILGAISKGDLDVLVRVTRNQFPMAIKAIESLGFSIKQGTLRTESLCMLEGPHDVARDVCAFSRSHECQPQPCGAIQRSQASMHRV